MNPSVAHDERSGSGQVPVFLRALVEASVPASEAPPSERARVIDATAGFVHGQIGALPWLFRWAFACGCTVFRTLVFVTHLRGFTDLPEARRRAIFAAWAWGRVSLGRQLFKVVRATAALAFFEHPAVAGTGTRRTLQVVGS